MKDIAESLSDRERETLRLLGQGHEAKSIASTLDVSVHSVNERLRTARRKLGVSSSREAARLLLAREAEAAPNNFGHKEIGVAGARADQPYLAHAQARATGAKRRPSWIVIGVPMLFVLISALMVGQPAHGARNAEPITSLPSLFGVSDYPAEAKGAQGITDFRLQISATGLVQKCEIERSSGSAALDQATCRVITKRARFRPATNAAGRAVSGTYTGMIHWVS